MGIEFSKGTIGKVKTEILSAKKIVITTHHNPDGDAIGSILGLMHSLKLAGINSEVISSNGLPAFLEWMPGADKIIKFSHKPDVVKQLFAEADLVFCLDFNGYSRTEKMEEVLEKTPAKKILIDHHPNPESPFDYYFSETRVSSTAELVYEFVTHIFGEQAINKDAAICLYVGIMTDTGSFSYACSRKRTFQIAGELVEKGVVVDTVQSLVYNNFSSSRMQMLGYCLVEKMKVMPEHKTAYIWLTKDEMKRFAYQVGDTEGFVNYPLSIKGIVFSVLFTENDGFVKVSLRSRGSFPVNEFSKKYYNGGGHTNAAGGKSFENMESTIIHFEEMLNQYSEQLNQSELQL